MVRSLPVRLSNPDASHPLRKKEKVPEEPLIIGEFYQEPVRDLACFRLCESL